MAESNAKLPPSLPPSGGNISPITIEAEMQKSYLDYAMSVIVSRALPDVRDGLKPVHRRILYAMQQGGYDSSKPYKKSARIVGDVMGKFHPHGDSAIYDAMVRMVQDFSMRVPLIDGQGNFGSMDDDPAAAMRYTEARLAKSAEAHLIDIEKDTVDYQPNYDDSDLEPIVLPARFPNLLVNGASGIAVGMATNIPPHNLGEVVDACCAMMANPAITDQEIYAIVPAPDFPTGAMILGRQGSLSFHSTGHGSIKMRGRTSIEEVRKDKMAIIIHDVPYQVNKARLIERIAEVVNEKIVEGITDVRDESDRDGVRMVIELRRDAQPDVVLNQLYKYTPLQTSFGGNLLALNRGRPERLNLRQALQAFLDFRVEVITRRTKFELAKARDRAHILAGLAVAVANVDPIIACIRQAPDPAAAREALLAKAWPVDSVQPLLEKLHDPNFNATDKTYRLSDVQAKAILELRLQRLTGLERDKIANELDDVVQDIARLLTILNDRTALERVLVEELQEVKAKFSTPRRTEIIDSEYEDDIEDLIASEDMVVTVSHAGYIKRVPLATYRAQNRGGKGRAAANLKDDDVVTDVFVADTLTPLLFFTTKGIVHSLKVYKLPLANPQARGKALVNMLPLAQDEKISVVLPMPDAKDGLDAQMNMLFATSHGTVRRNRLSDFRNIRSNGLIAMKLGDDERLISVKVASDEQDVLLFSKLGKSIRFAIDELRVFAGRTSTGVRGINLGEGDEVIGMSVLQNVPATSDERTLYLKLTNAERRLTGDDGVVPSYEAIVAEAAQTETMTEARYQELTAMEEYLLTVTNRGFGKRTSAFEYRQTGRGGQGITNIDLTDKNGLVVASYPVAKGCDLLLVTDAGQMIRTPASQIRVAGRATQGVTLFRVAADESVVSVEVIAESDSEETVQEV